MNALCEMYACIYSYFMHCSDSSQYNLKPYDEFAFGICIESHLIHSTTTLMWVRFKHCGPSTWPNCFRLFLFSRERNKIHCLTARRRAKPKIMHNSNILKDAVPFGFCIRFCLIRKSVMPLVPMSPFHRVGSNLKRQKKWFYFQMKAIKQWSLFAANGVE